MITRLQKQCYAVISDFRYMTDKSGKEYGWGVANYSTPEKFFGESFTSRVYSKTPQESYEAILKHFKTILPGVEDDKIVKILK